MSKLRKIFTISVMLVTVLSMSVVVAPKAQAAASAGDLIKMEGLSSVYYLAGDGKRYVFPNESTYFSWYSDFSSVVTVSQSELESYPLGYNVTVRPGTKLVKITTNPKVFAVESDGSLVWVPSETVATTLFGANWAKRVIDVSDAFWNNYTETTKQVSATAYPEGSLVKFGTSADVYYIAGDGTARKIASEAAFVANRFNWNDVVTTTITMPTTGTEITGAEADVTDTSSGAGGTIGAGSGLTVALASDSPAAATYVRDDTTGVVQSLTPFAKINFTAASDGDVKITKVNLTRSGLSADTDLNKVYLYDGNTLLAEHNSITSKVVTFSNSSGLFTVTAGTTRSITVKVDSLATNATVSSIALGINTASDITTNGATVSGSFPVTGAQMAYGTVTDLGYVNIATVGAGDFPATINPGETNQQLFKFTTTASSQDMMLEYMKFTVVGTVSATDLANFQLETGGVKIGSMVASMNDSKEIIFDLTSNPYKITAGQSKIISVQGDVLNGSNKAFKFTIRKAADFVAKDNGYGVYVAPLYNSAAFALVDPDSSGTGTTVNPGTLTVEVASDSPSGNVAAGADGVPLARWNVKATGEDVKIVTMKVEITAGVDLDDGKLYLDGSQVGATDPVVTDTVGNAFTVNQVIKAGKTGVFEYRANLDTLTVAIADGTTIVPEIIASGANVYATGQSSLATVSVTGSTAYTLTAKTGALSVAKNSSIADASVTNPTGVKGQSGVKVGSFTLTAGAGEAVTITQITVGDDGDQTTEDFGDNFQNLILKHDGVSISGTNHGTLLGTAGADFAFALSPSVVIGAGQQYVVDVFADILTGAAGFGTGNIGLEFVSAAATGNVTSTDATGSLAVTNLQTVVISTGGSLTVENVPSSSQVQSNIIYAGQVSELYKFKLTANIESTNVSRVIITDTIASLSLGATTASGKPTTSIVNFELYDGVNKIAGPIQLTATSTPTNGGYISFTLPTQLTVVPGTPKTLTVKGTVNNWSAISSGSTHQFSIRTDSIQDGSTKAITARTVNSSTAVNGPSSNLAGNTMTVRRAYPVVVREALPTSTLSSGTTNGASLAKFNVTANGGEVRLKKMTFDISLTDTTTSTALALSNFKVLRNGVDMNRGTAAANGEVAMYDGLGTATANTLTLSSGGRTLSTDTLKGASLGAANTTSTRMVLVFNAYDDFDAADDAAGEEIITAGETNVYEIKADIANAHQGTPTTDADSIVITMVADDGQSSPLTGDLGGVATATYRNAVIGIGSTNYNFIWSDYSANTGDHTNIVPLGTGGDWAHGYQVRSTASTPASYIPLDAWTLSK